MTLSIFSCAYWPFAYFLWKNFCLNLYFLIGYLSFSCGFLGVLQIFWIHVPYQIYGLQIFSPIPWVVCSVSWWYPLKQKSFKCWSSPLSFFFCHFCFTPMFFSKSCVVSVLTFRPVTHFELSFLYMVWGRGLGVSMGYCPHCSEPEEQERKLSLTWPEPSLSCSLLSPDSSFFTNCGLSPVWNTGERWGKRRVSPNSHKSPSPWGEGRGAPWDRLAQGILGSKGILEWGST